MMSEEAADMFMLSEISPDLTCQCDEFHICQQCAEDLTEADYWDGDDSYQM
jgi:hypothetical protein